MRNLRCIRYGSWEYPADITAVCWDPAKDEILCTVGPTEENQSIELIRVSERELETSHEVVAKWDIQSPSPDSPVDKVLSLHHSSDTLTTTLVFANGDIAVVRENGVSAPDSPPHIEIVGSIDDGISAARWSPDEELLIVVTKADEVMFMGRNFDPIAEVKMTEEDLQASKHVSVGWGKKETQFQGRGAKAHRDPTIPEKVDEGVLSPQDDDCTAVSWRGDGAYVAINSIHDSKRRVVRVYDREGALDGVSEPVDGLEGTLSWRPAGNLIAGIQRLPERTDVVFFERNGLRHGQFTLRSTAEKIKLEWNADSTVLAVTLNDRVQLWTMGNYHWYLKQEIPLQNPFTSWAWHPERPLRFAASTTDTVVLAEYAFTTAHGSLVPPDDFGAVAVIDGSTVKITPFRTCNMPPPMSMFDLTTKGNVIDVAFVHDDSLIGVLHSEGVDIYEWQVKNGRRVAPILVDTTQLPGLEAGSKELPLQIFSAGPRLFCVLSTGFENMLHPCAVDTDAKVVHWEDQIGLPGISCMAFVTEAYRGRDGAYGYIHTKGGSDFMVQQPEGQLSDQIPFRLPVHVPWIKIAPVGETAMGFGLTRNGHLYANDRVLAKNCTSFLVTASHLVFTTNNHLVKFVHLDAVDEMEVPADDPEIDERCRSIERGARLVTAMPTNMSLVLQMPRGNVETIFPRAMVLAGIRNLIDEKNYKRAFAYCRTQRVDMNLLYDHHPAQFLANVGLFLEQLEDVTYIDLFLSSLREEDVSQTMYKDTKRQGVTNNEAANDETQGPRPGDKSSKVNRICDAVLKSLQANNSSNIQNIITAHVCKAPPALEDGLRLVAELMREGESLAEKAVEHICFLVDVNRLYEHALGLYDLNLTLLVAQQSQKDPREYVPFVQSLHEMPEVRRRFAIDDHLARRAKALGHLKDLKAFDEVQEYTVKHNLYQEALRLYRYDEGKTRVLTGLYANFLQATSKFRDAGLAYESLGDFAKATSSYRAAGATSWRECLFAAQQQQDPPLSAEAQADLAGTLAEALWEAKDYASAAAVHDEYLDQPEAAVRCLCKAYLFADAMRLVVRRGRQDLLTTAVDTGITDALASSTEFLADCKAQLGAQVPRILELRRRANEDPLSFFEGERHGGADVPDDISVAASSRLSTSASLFTRYTGKDKSGGSVGTLGSEVSRATSRNRKREEKKRARGRKGTVYEEEYLVNSVRRLVDRVSGSVALEVERLVVALWRREMAERARAVEALMAEVVEGCKKAVADVFPPTVGEGGGGEVGNGNGNGYQTTGAEGVMHEVLEGRAKMAEAPVVADFKRLSLLG